VRPFARLSFVPTTALPPPPNAPKAVWRRWALARRRELAAADPARRADVAVAARLRGWESWRTAQVVLVYLAFGSELDPLAGDLLDEALSRGPRLATTRTPEDGRGLEIHAFDPARLESHPLGFHQPRPDAPRVEPAAIDLAVVPGLCFDVQGGRLGYGRGYYDRLLPVLPRRVATVGVTREALVVPRLPTAPHDVAVGWLLTEAGLRPAYV
jgi:5-formyltetrahydrofolate cyclo-ligase